MCSAKAPVLIGPYVSIADGLILECKLSATATFTTIDIGIGIGEPVSFPKVVEASCLLSLVLWMQRPACERRKGSNLGPSIHQRGKNTFDCFQIS